MRSTMATFRYLRTLTPQQRAALAQKRIEGEFSAVQLLELLRPLAEFDGLNDRARGKTIWLIVLLIIAALITLFVVSVSNPMAAWIASGLMFAAAVALIGIEFRLRGLDVSNNVRKVALPFLAVLREDTPRDAPLHVQIDFAKPIVKAKQVSKKPPYQKGRYHRVVDTLYRDAWFSGSAQLADGSRLRWEVVEDIVVSHCRKRNPRGKIKLKTKHAKRSQLHVSVALPRRNYQFGEIEKSPGTRAAVSVNDKRTLVKLSHKLKSRSLEPFDVRELINLVSAAYRPVSPANQEAA